ncbi:MAG: serine hydrolase [Candidatus Symbiobacter sp.]|nr:serine hydrolase [Candidatus Symbiobacter sp.]
MTLSLAQKFVPNRDFVLYEDNKARWNNIPYRRYSFHHLDEVSRYTQAFRAGAVLPLKPAHDDKTAAHPLLQKMVTHPWFSAMIVVQADKILFEEYADDFSPRRRHSMQSLTKTMLHLMLGVLIEQGKLNRDATVATYIPEIGSGYRDATIQQVMNMDVANDYIGNFDDPHDKFWAYEESMGWRLNETWPHEPTIREYLLTVEKGVDPKGDTRPPGIAKYKDTNSDLLGWIVELVSGRPLGWHLADLMDAAGIEGQMVIATDRSGVPIIDGGACMTARDTARYGLIFTRLNQGEKIMTTTNGGVWGAPRLIGSRDFMRETLVPGGTYWKPEKRDEWYKNQSEGDGRSIAHAGYCGQYLYANLDTGKVGVYFSVSQTQSGTCDQHHAETYKMLQQVTALS